MAGFENPAWLVLLVLVAPAVYAALKRRERYSYLIGASRFLALSLLVVAAASPFITTDQKVSETAELTVLKDSSFSTQLLNSPDLDAEEVEIREKVIASGNSSDLKSGFLRNIEPDSAYLASSDFQSSETLEGVAEAFRRKNSTLYALKTGADEEASVTVEGPSTTVPGAENRFRIRVHSTGEIPEPEVTVDGEPAELERTANTTWEFTRAFQEKGSHTIKASIEVNDRWSRNNRFYSSVDVTEKPEILVIGSQGSLGDSLEKFYSLEYKNSLPDDLSDYYTVIAKEHVKSPELERFVIEGNGLVYTGDYEKGMGMLPVKSVPEDQQSKGAKVMLVIDVSKSTESSVKQEKKLAFNLVEQLPFNNRVGAIAYNREAFIISKPKVLASHREELKQKISRIKTGGNSFHHNGLKGAREILNGTGNIVMLTDGKISSFGRNVDTKRKSREIASDLDVRLITIGVGEDSNREFLEELAERGNGYYLDMRDTGRLQFTFGAGGASGNTEPLVVTNPNHFITDGIELTSSSSVFDSVEPKIGADLLVTGTSGKPFLTTWRYGIGRVAAFSGGARDLSQVSRVDPVFVTRTVSWAVGDPKRKRDRWLKVESSRRPEDIEAKASYDLPGFRRQGSDLYTREFSPGSLGFHRVQDRIYGYNYNPEFEKIGYSDSMRDIVRDTGGKVFKPGEEKQLIQEVKKLSERKVEKKKSLSSYFIIAALLILLTEIGYRKRRGKR